MNAPVHRSIQKIQLKAHYLIDSEPTFTNRLIVLFASMHQMVLFPDLASKNGAILGVRVSANDGARRTTLGAPQVSPTEMATSAISTRDQHLDAMLLAICHAVR